MVRAEVEVDDANVWVMKEYGVKESWTKLFTLRQANVGPLCSTPIVYSKERDELLLRKEGDSNGFFWFSLESKTLKSVDHLFASHDVSVCVGSLVPLPT